MLDPAPPRGRRDRILATLVLLAACSMEPAPGEDCPGAPGCPVAEDGSSGDGDERPEDGDTPYRSSALGQQLLEDGLISGVVTDPDGWPIGSFEVTGGRVGHELVFDGVFATQHTRLVTEHRMARGTGAFSEIMVVGADGSVGELRARWDLDAIRTAEGNLDPPGDEAHALLLFAADLFDGLLEPAPPWTALPVGSLCPAGADDHADGPDQCGVDCWGAIASVPVDGCWLVDGCSCLIPGGDCGTPRPADTRVGCCRWASGQDPICTKWLRPDGSCW